MKGFELIVKDIVVPSECVLKDDYYLKLLIILNKKRELNTSRWNSYLEKCLPQMGKAFRAFLKLKIEDHFSNGDSLSHFMKLYQVPKKEIETIFQMVKVQGQILEKRKQIDSFSQLINNGIVVRPGEEKYFSYRKVIETFEKSSFNFLKKLSEVFVAIDSKNYSWAKRKLDEVASYDIYQLIYDFQPPFFDSAESYQEFLKSSFKLFQLAQSRLENTRELELALINMSVILQIKGYESFKENFDLSLAEIRERVKKGIRLKNIGIWHELLSKRGADAEVQNLLKTELKGRKLEKLTTNSIKIIREFFPRMDRDRKRVLKVIEKMVKSKDSHQQYVLLQLIQNGIIKRSLKEGKFKKANFQLQRDFFRNSLKKGESIQFNLYNLIKLGDLDESLLWWLAL